MGSFAGPTLPTWAARLLEGGLGSVCLFGSNIPAYAGVRALSDAVHAAGADVLVATDEEGGDVTRLHTRRGQRRSRATPRSAPSTTRRSPDASPPRSAPRWLQPGSTWTWRRSST